MRDLASTGVYCAGLTTPAAHRPDAYDLYVDLPAKTITVSPSAKEVWCVCVQ